MRPLRSSLWAPHSCRSIRRKTICRSLHRRVFPGRRPSHTTHAYAARSGSSHWPSNANTTRFLDPPWRHRDAMPARRPLTHSLRPAQSFTRTGSCAARHTSAHAHMCRFPPPTRGTVRCTHARELSCTDRLLAGRSHARHLPHIGTVSVRSCFIRSTSADA